MVCKGIFLLKVLNTEYATSNDIENPFVLFVHDVFSIYDFNYDICIIGIARTTQRVHIITVIEYWGSFVALKTAKDRTTGIVSNFLNPSNLMKVGPQTKVTRKIGLYAIAITKLL